MYDFFFNLDLCKSYIWISRKTIPSCVSGKNTLSLNYKITFLSQDVIKRIVDRYIRYQMKNKSTGKIKLNCKIKVYSIRQQVYEKPFHHLRLLLYIVSISQYIIIIFLVSLEELKQDVSSFRFEILNNLKTLKKEREQDLISLKEEQKASPPEAWSHHVCISETAGGTWKWSGRNHWNIRTVIISKKCVEKTISIGVSILSTGRENSTFIGKVLLRIKWIELN